MKNPFTFVTNVISHLKVPNRKISSLIKNNHYLNNCFSNKLSKNVCSKISKCKQLKITIFKKTFKCKVCLRQFSDQTSCVRHTKNQYYVKSNIY